MSLDRRTFLELSGLALAAGLLSPSRALAEEIATGFKELRGGVGYFWGRGGTIGWYVGKGGVAVVDTQFPATAESCRAGLATRSPRKVVDVLINSHHHGDHTAGNGVFRQVAERIVAHARVPVLQKKTATKRDNLADQVYADTTFEKSWSTELGGERIALSHHGRAHTGGDSVIHFENANVVHTGDLVFNRWHPYVNLEDEASLSGWVKTLDGMLARFDDDTIFIFGHGSEKHGVTGAKADVAVMRAYLEAVLETAQKGLAGGMSREEVTALALTGFDEHESPGDVMSAPHSLGVAYDELSRP